MSSMKIIHVNRNLIAQNKGRENLLPVLSVKEGKTNTYCYEIKINGPSEMIYSPDDPLACGATLWLRTEAELELKNPMTWQEVQEMK